ncbi:hypothetical protein CANCADRAFT_55562 [Tortispora caseinolytica NRRL Y-17796]|uniref:Dihydrolipoyl dehydrogenase n=1 Tax=Tortispora caseinolytica NRRL Y-17796 TaxID=767744 RepID=A0A1E4TJ44_9ASCO|nr:hypothetical protein CANCADRAFT_55562 [Tortispora caseinolytica NRRL Y-17796]
MNSLVSRFARSVASTGSLATRPSASFALCSSRGYASKTAEHDVLVIGGGPGGYVAAIKAAQLGLNTACVEMRGRLGGTCLNVGCIPSKSLLNNSMRYHDVLHDSKKRGVIVGNVELDLAQMMKAKDESVDQLTGGIEMLFKKNKVTYYKGKGSFIDEHQVQIDAIEGGEDTIVNAKNIIIATGSEPTPFPGIEVDEKRIVSSTGAIALPEVPKRLAIIGGGIIGLEMASVWSRLGSEVTILEFLPAIGGAGMDSEVSKTIQKLLQKQGLKFKTGTKVLGAKVDGEEVHIDLENAKSGKQETIVADTLLVAVGRRPYTEGLGLEKIGIELDERKRVVMDNEYRTKFPHIRVIGDCTFGPMLAHKAEEEGIAAAEYIKLGHGHVNYGVIPSVMYTHPEVAWVGQSEQQVKESGKAYNVGKFPYLANSRAKTNLDTDGFVKFITDKETDRILGCHIIGANAGEAIAEAALALEYGASAEDVARTCHAHPTLSEAVKEAALSAYDKPINF